METNIDLPIEHYSWFLSNVKILSCECESDAPTAWESRKVKECEREREEQQ